MKHLSRIIIGLTLLVPLSLIGIHFYLTPTRLHDLFQPHLEKTFQRPVTFQNTQLHYGFEPSIEIQNFTVQDRAPFAHTPLIKATRAQLTFSPIAFLTGQNRIGTLHLQNSHIHITRNRRGQHNIDDLLQKKMRVPINQLTLSNTTLTYNNQQTEHINTLHISQADLMANLVLQGMEVIGKVALENLVRHTPTDTTQLWGGAVDIDLLYNPKTQQANFKHLTLHLGPLTIPLQGHIDWQTLTTDLHTQEEPLDFERIKTDLVNRSVLSSQATLSGTGHLSVHITGPWPPTLHAQLTASNISLSAPTRLKHPLIKGTLNLAIDTTHMRLHTLQFQSGLSDITLSGVIPHIFQRPHLSFVAQSHILDIDNLFVPPANTLSKWGFASPAYAALDTKKSALISVLNRLDIDGSIRADSLRLYNTWIQNLNVTTHAQNGTLTLKPITGQTYTGALLGDLSIATHEQGAILQSTLSLTNAHAHPLVNQTFNWQIPLYGGITVTARATGALDTTGTYLPLTTKANGTFHMPAGKLIAWDVLQENLTGIDQLGLLTADEVPLQDATLVFDLQGNILTLNGTHLTAANMPCRLNGTGALNGTLNYTLDIDVPASRIQFGGFNLGALFGQNAIPIRVNIGGTSQAPRITAGLR